MQNISKAFPGIQTLDTVNFDLKAGEVHVLLGENGAGKSTLIKILSGTYQKDKGNIYLNDKSVKIENPHRARSLGIATTYQERPVFEGQCAIRMAVKILNGESVAKTWTAIMPGYTNKRGKI